MGNVLPRMIIMKEEREEVCVWAKWALIYGDGFAFHFVFTILFIIFYPSCDDDTWTKNVSTIFINFFTNIYFLIIVNKYIFIYHFNILIKIFFTFSFH